MVKPIGGVSSSATRTRGDLFAMISGATMMRWSCADNSDLQVSRAPLTWCILPGITVTSRWIPYLYRLH